MKYVRAESHDKRLANPLLGRRIDPSCSVEILLSDEKDVADCKGLRRSPLVESLRSFVFENSSTREVRLYESSFIRDISTITRLS